MLYNLVEDWNLVSLSLMKEIYNINKRKLIVIKYQKLAQDRKPQFSSNVSQISMQTKYIKPVYHYRFF